MLITLICVCGWISPSSFADPLHQYGSAQQWRHENSGWKFVDEAAGFKRATSPYTIDGGSDVGAHYTLATTGPTITAIVEVFSADSTATDASLEGAKDTAAQRVSDSGPTLHESAFRLNGKPELVGVKVSFGSHLKSGSHTVLYFFGNDRWHVKVLATAVDDAPSHRALDEFVQALPWSSLGTDPNVF